MLAWFNRSKQLQVLIQLLFDLLKVALEVRFELLGFRRCGGLRSPTHYRVIIIVRALGVIRLRVANRLLVFMRDMACLPPASASSIIRWGLLFGAAGLLEPAHPLRLVPAALIVDDVGAGAQHADHRDAGAQDERSVLGATAAAGGSV